MERPPTTETGISSCSNGSELVINTILGRNKNKHLISQKPYWENSVIRHNKMLIIITRLRDYRRGLESDKNNQENINDHRICKYFQILQTLDRDAETWGPGATSSGFYLINKPREVGWDKAGILERVEICNSIISPQRGFCSDSSLSECNSCSCSTPLMQFNLHLTSLSIKNYYTLYTIILL